MASNLFPGTIDRGGVVLWGTGYCNQSLPPGGWLMPNHKVDNKEKDLVMHFGIFIEMAT